MKNNIMIDLETLAVSNNALFPSLAAVQFDIRTGEIGERFKMNVDVADAQAAGLHIDAKTIQWWLTQKPEVAKLMFEGVPDSLYGVLTSFNVWLHSLVEDIPLYLWGNSARFDLGILENAYKAMKLDVPWSHRNEMCYRTIKNLYPDAALKPDDRAGHHDPIEDCLYQIEHLCNIYKHIGNNSQYKDSKFENDYGIACKLLDNVVVHNGHLSMDQTEEIKSFIDGSSTDNYIQSIVLKNSEAVKILTELSTTISPDLINLRNKAQKFLGVKPNYRFNNSAHGFTEGADL